MQPELTDHDRCTKVNEVMADLLTKLRTDKFEDVHPARWRHLATGNEIETGYTRGEGRVRIYKGTSRKPVVSLTFLGGKDEHAGMALTLLDVAATAV